MAAKTIDCLTADDTEALGERLGRLIDRPMTLACYGDLGAGKTTFARGIGRGLEVSQSVTSPTFVLQHIYQGRLPVYHFDAYRLDSARDLLELGLEECDDGVVLLEWSERVLEALPPERLELRFSLLEEGRRVSLSAIGPELERLLEALC
ncbi:tRNA (adenosine(37)-N6)-threonylcarbamoyltransferase complex ATPase subunit type 1 TsaE [bacterium CPR1]|nr:tRNA (adenosine(37)-N6)-threonylcarbamoyltransferase complex ATPase subunit type 1 TsaE [bacterium CPR1]